MKASNRQFWIKWITLVITGIYIITIIIWKFLDPKSLNEVGGLALIPGVLIIIFVLIARIRFTF